MCELAMNIFSSRTTGDTVPVATQQRVMTTCVQIKRLLHQPIGPTMNWLKEKFSHLFVFCAHLKLMSMASECSWSDAVVELQVWCQLAAVCYHVMDHSLVLRCTQNALQLEEAAVKSLNTAPCLLSGPTAVSEMLSRAACWRGLSLVCESSGDPDIYREALKVLRSGVSFAEKADNLDLCVTAAGLFWNTCLPLTQNPEERRQLREELENILTTLARTTTHGNKQNKVRGSLAPGAMPYGKPQHGATNDDMALALRAAIYGLLVSIHTDEADYGSALKLLTRAVRDTSHTRHQLPLLKDHIFLKAHLGESIELDMEALKGEGGECCSSVWHQAALWTRDINQQLTCYQRAVTSLMSSETLWHKVDILLEFGRWLYFHKFPREYAQQQIQWAVDILLTQEPAEAADSGSVAEMSLATEKHESLLGLHGSGLKEVRRLDLLVQAHVLLAVMSETSSEERWLNLLRAHTFVLQIWQVSTSVACPVSDDMVKTQPPQTPLSDRKGKKKKVRSLTPAEDKPAVLDQMFPSSVKDWAQYVCPDLLRQIFRTSISTQTQSLFYLTLLEKELLALSLHHLTLPILHLAETIAHDLLERRSLSDLYRLKIVRTCLQLGLDSSSPYQEKLLDLSRIQEEEQMRGRSELLYETRSRLHKGFNLNADLRKDVSARDLWLEKAELCLSLGLHQAARQLLAEAHQVAAELGDEVATSRSLLSLAALACEDQNHRQALILLEEAQSLGGNAEFWYRLTLIRVSAAVGLRDQDSQTKVDAVIQRGIEALEAFLDGGQEENRVQELQSMITSLNKRGAVEDIRAVRAKAAETLSADAVQRLIAACQTLRESAGGFTKLSLHNQAAEAHQECSRGLRLLASCVTDREQKRRFLLHGFSQMQLAVTLQERVVLAARRLLPPQEGHDLSLAAGRRLLHLRLCLAEFSLDMLEEHCAEETCQALARAKRTSAEVALQEFTRSTPEPNSTEQEWVSAVRTSGPMAQSQLDAVRLQSSDNAEITARCLSLMGKFLRLQAVQEEPTCVKVLWDRGTPESGSGSDDVPTAEQNSEKARDSSEDKPSLTSARSADLQKRLKAQQLLTEASRTSSDAINLCLQHHLSADILAGASLNMMECLGLCEPAATGQCLALFQTCCTVAMVEEVLSSACSDTSDSQLSALLSIRRNLLDSQEERPSSTLKSVEDSLSSSFKAFSHLTISPNHLNILSEIPTNLKIFLLQHSKDGSELYGGFYEATEEPEPLQGKTAQVKGSVTCSRVAKASVCPRALQKLRMQIRTFDQERQSILTDESRNSVEARPEASEEHQKTAADTKLELHFREILKDLDHYLGPLLCQFDSSCLRTQAGSLSVAEMTKSKDQEEQCSSDKGEPGEYVLLLADRKLLELPLEASSFLQGLGSVSRDFSLQLFYSRLRREPQKVERDNKKKSKGVEATKGRGDQSQTIKQASAKHLGPSYTFAFDAQNFKYVVDPLDKGEINLSMGGKEVMNTYSHHWTHLWEMLLGSTDRPSLFQREQVLCRCSGFVYLGMDPLLANFPPSKLAALNLPECRMVLLFDRVLNRTSVLHQPDLQRTKSSEQLSLENPLEATLLLSLSGVGCIVLNQWHSSLLQNTHDAAAVLDHTLGLRLSCGQTIQTLRRRGDCNTPHHNHKDQVFFTSSKEKAPSDPALPSSAFNCVLYGLPQLTAS